MSDDPARAKTPQLELMNLIIGDWKARAVYTAAELGWPDQLADGPRTAAQVAAASGTDPVATQRFLQYLTALGVFREEDGSYSLAELGELLRSDREDSLRPYTLIAGSEFHRAWTDIASAVRTGQNAFEGAFQSSFFEYLSANPERGKLFDRAMAGNTALFDAVPGAYGFGAHQRFVDVGGGSGELAVRLLAAHQQLRGTVYDAEQSAEAAKKAIADAGLTERCEVASGDFLESVPEGGDVYLLARVLVNWPDEDCARILANCAAAAAPGARLLLVERVSGPGVDNALLLSHDTLMYVLFGGGGIRSSAEVTRLLEEAGFALDAITPLPQEFSLISATRRS